MTAISSSLRIAVIARAGKKCEYCHLPTRGQVATFPIDHVTPRILNGETVVENLALACPRCNGHKWKYADGIDVHSGQMVPLFNPRTANWNDNFKWSESSIGVHDAVTPCGRATLARLQMNGSDVVAVRQLLAELGLFDEILIEIANRQ